MWRTKIGKDWDAGQTGYDVIPQIGSWVKPDGWSYGAYTIPCKWDGAQFRIPGNYGDYSLDVKITGRCTRQAPGLFKGEFVRVKITWVHDGEPNVPDRGWMEVTRKEMVR